MAAMISSTHKLDKHLRGSATYAIKLNASRATNLANSRDRVLR